MIHPSIYWKFKIVGSAPDKIHSLSWGWKIERERETLRERWKEGGRERERETLREREREREWKTWVADEKPGTKNGMSD